MSYVDFTKPYPNGWADGSEGETPITAQILNNNYDAFLLGLNSWAEEVPTLEVNPESGISVGNLSSLKVNAVKYTVSEVHANPTVPGGTTPPDLSYIQIDGNNYTIPSGGGATTLNGLTDVTISSPSNGQVLTYNGTSSKWENTNASGGGDSVSWTQVQATGTKIATITINNTATDVYAPNAGSGGWTDVTGTLTAGSTSITLSDNSITTSSTIDIYTDLDVPYNSKSLSTGSITITFDAQSSNMSVKVRVS